MIDAYAATEKRVELVRAAQSLLHERGFHRTTLADVAQAAKVPLGNVYYYYKTKEALAEAVIDAHEAALRDCVTSWSKAHESPRERLARYVRAPLDAADSVIEFGCPHGSLCQELEKLGPRAPLAKASARLMAVYVDWAAEQFRALGHRTDARELASELVAAVQGTLLLAHTLRSRAFLVKQLGRVERRFIPPRTRTRRSR